MSDTPRLFLGLYAATIALPVLWQLVNGAFTVWIVGVQVAEPDLEWTPVLVFAVLGVVRFGGALILGASGAFAAWVASGIASFESLRNASFAAVGCAALYGVGSVCTCDCLGAASAVPAVVFAGVAAMLVVQEARMARARAGE